MARSDHKRPSSGHWNLHSSYSWYVLALHRGWQESVSVDRKQIIKYGNCFSFCCTCLEFSITFLTLRACSHDGAYSHLMWLSRGFQDRFHMYGRTVKLHVPARAMCMRLYEDTKSPCSFVMLLYCPIEAMLLGRIPLIYSQLEHVPQSFLCWIPFEIRGLWRYNRNGFLGA